MTTTESEKAVLLTEAWKYVGGALKSVRLSEEDYSDLRATCIEAADRAIDSWTEDGGRTLPSWIYRYIIQAKRDYFTAREGKQKSFERDALSFSSLHGDDVEVPFGDTAFESEHSRQSEHNRKRIQEMEITIDMARNDGVISEREYRILTMRRQNARLVDVAEKLGKSSQMIYVEEQAAIAKIRFAYNTAE